MYIQRSALRLPNGWHRLMGWKGAYVRDLMGHHLVIFHGKTPKDPNWYEWMDGYFKGFTAKLREAKLQLEKEATGGGTAWGSKLDGVDTLANADGTPRSTIGCSPVGSSTLCMFVRVGSTQSFVEGGSSVGGLMGGVTPSKQLLEKNEGEADEAIA